MLYCEQLVVLQRSTVYLGRPETLVHRYSAMADAGDLFVCLFACLLALGRLYQLTPSGCLFTCVQCGARVQRRTYPTYHAALQMAKMRASAEHSQDIIAKIKWTKR